MRFSLERSPFRGRTGRGVRVAVIDSGIHADNPHIARAVEGVRIGPEGTGQDVADRIGHGTAVAAAILEKAPAIELVAVRVFDRTLATNAAVLARAITWAAENRCRLINLSLGTANAERVHELRAAADYALSHGAIIASARSLAATPWFPGSLPGLAGVLLDDDCPRDELRVDSGPDDEPIFHASGYPRPIPDIPPERNLRGISFAVANVTGFLARLLEDRPELRTTEDLHDALDRCRA